MAHVQPRLACPIQLRKALVLFCKAGEAKSASGSVPQQPPVELSGSSGEMAVAHRQAGHPRSIPALLLLPSTANLAHSDSAPPFCVQSGAAWCRMALSICGGYLRHSRHFCHKPKGHSTERQWCAFAGRRTMVCEA